MLVREHVENGNFDSWRFSDLPGPKFIEQPEKFNKKYYFML